MVVACIGCWCLVVVCCAEHQCREKTKLIVLCFMGLLNYPNLFDNLFHLRFRFGFGLYLHFLLII